MALTVNTSLPSPVQPQAASVDDGRIRETLKRLATERSTRAAEDTATIAPPESSRPDIRASSQIFRNANDGASMLQVADAGLSAISANLGRMRELAATAADEGLGDIERAALQDEFRAVTEEIDRAATSTAYNGTSLLDGSASFGIRVQTRVHGSADSQVTLKLRSAKAADMGATGGDGQAPLTYLADQAIATAEGARAALGSIAKATEEINDSRIALGTASDRLSNLRSNLGEEVSASRSEGETRIREVEVAAEMVSTARDMIAVQPGVAMLAQATQSHSVAMALLL